MNLKILLGLIDRKLKDDYLSCANRDFLFYYYSKPIVKFAYYKRDKDLEYYLTHKGHFNVSN